MMDKELTMKILGDVGPLRFNPYVIKICQNCGVHAKVRYKGFNKPSSPYFCRKCVVNRPEVKQKLSDCTSKQWKSTDFANRVTENSKRIWTNPDLNKKMSVVRTDPIKKASMIKANKDKWLEKSHQDKMTQIRSQYPHISSIQKSLYSILDDLKIQYFGEFDDHTDQQCIIGPYIFDCVISREGKKTMLIECQGDYWHSLPSKQSRDLAKSNYISNNFPDQYELKYIWEHEFKCKDRIIETIKHWLGLTTLEVVDFDFDLVSILDCPSSDYKLLLSKYHYLANAGRGGIAYGAYLNNELIAVCVFSPLVRQNMPYDYDSTRELSRLCIHPKYQKKNFASWFVGKCIKKLDPKFKTIISYCDTTFNHDGATYRACNFMLDGEVDPDYWYSSPDGWIMHKKSLYNHAVRMHMSESEYAEKLGYKKVWGSKKLRFIFTR
jgi:hypothetical protein